MTKDAVKILDHVTGKDADIQRMIADERENLRIARIIYNARTKAGFTQKQLADLIGTRQPTIARLEDADYGGHSLNMLRRIAEALGQRVEVRFVPKSASPEEKARGRASN